MNTLRARWIKGPEPSARLQLQWTLEPHAPPLFPQTGQETDDHGGEYCSSTSTNDDARPQANHTDGVSRRKRKAEHTLLSVVITKV